MDLELFIKRVSKLRRCLPSPILRRALFQGVLPSIEHAPALQSLHPSAIVDVGANIGQFAVFARFLWPEATIVSFEPLPDQYRKLVDVMQGDANFHAFNLALSSSSGSSVLFRTVDADSSSLMAPTTLQREISRGSTVEQRVPVDVITGNEALRTLWQDPHRLGAGWLLKIDVQGAERDVLSGFSPLPDACRHVFCECSFQSLYEGQALASECIALLSQSGFQLSGIGEAMKDRAGRVVQADMLFERARSS